MNERNTEMNANDHRITWCLNWGEDAVSGWSACYCVNPDQERGRRELRDGTSDVLYRLHLHHKTGKGWYLAFGIDYLPNHERVTQWHESVADCWREMLTLGVSEITMKRIEYDICGENTYADRAPAMLEYFRRLCGAQIERTDTPELEV